jgi:hypothetical protein
LYFLLFSSATSSGRTAVNGSVLNDSTGAPVTFTLSNAGILTASVGAVPLPAAVWLLGSGLLGLIGIGRRRASGAVAA